ncbi:hypothetical protein ACPV51_25930, partial [Vibrio astriarenae]
SFTLPLASEEEIQASQTLAARGHFQIPDLNMESNDDLSLPENPNGPLLYVADDEPVNLRVLESFLRLEGYRVRTISDGPDTLALIKKEKPEL